MILHFKTQILSKFKNGRFRLTFLSVIIIILTSCKESPKENNGVKKEYFDWLGMKIDKGLIQNESSIYKMTDSLGKEVGEMRLKFELIEDRLVTVDTSYFYDRRLYETATYNYDFKKQSLTDAKIDINTQGHEIKVDLKNNDNKINGTYDINKDTLNIRHIKVDSLYAFKTFREEIFMFIHAVKLSPKDTLNFDMFYPNNIDVISSQLIAMADEEIDVSGKKIQTEKLYLKTKGGSLDNIFWISKKEPRRMIKIQAPNFKLTLTKVLE